MRDVIMISGCTWEDFNISERVARSFALLGARVLYCAGPMSQLKNNKGALTELEPGIWGFTPKIWAHRFNRWPVVSTMQAKMIADQISQHSTELNLRNPIVLYPYMAGTLGVCEELKRRGHYIVHVSGDHPQPNLMAHVALADQTFAVIPTAYRYLRAEFGDRIHFLPETAPSEKDQIRYSQATIEHPSLAGIPRPRLVYLGVPHERLHSRLLREMFTARPDWHFVHFGASAPGALPNFHGLPWISKDNLDEILAGTDVGFMPYDCRIERDFHCAPLKLFDYFAAGLPVVSTPIIYVWNMEHLVYTGDTTGELIAAVESALSEPTDSPKRANRKLIAREHSIENIAALMSQVLPIHE
jgi:Glycosyl transferases group 1